MTIIRLSQDDHPVSQDDHPVACSSVVACPHMQRIALMLDMRVIFAGMPAGLRDLPSVEMEGSAWLLSIRV